MFAIAFADVLLFSSTEFSMIPVTGGKMHPPKKRTNHMKIAKRLKLTNGTGRAQTTANPPNTC